MAVNIVNKIREFIPKNIRMFIFRRLQFPKVGEVKPYNLFSLEPISSTMGEDRGTPVDRYYIEKFLDKNSDLIKGKVLEIADNFYTLKYGKEKVVDSEILHASDDNPKATYIGNLENIPQIESDRFDCIICTQTLYLIPDVEKAISTLYRILKKGGALLVTVPGICKICQNQKQGWLDYWRFTKNSGFWLFSKKFDPVNIKVESHGNILSSIAFLHGLAHEELKKEDLDYQDEDYQLLISIKAIK